MNKIDDLQHVYKKINVTNKNIKAIIESNEFSKKDKMEMILIATEVIYKIIKEELE